MESSESSRCFEESRGSGAPLFRSSLVEDTETQEHHQVLQFMGGHQDQKCELHH